MMTNKIYIFENPDLVVIPFEKIFENIDLQFLNYTYNNKIAKNNYFKFDTDLKKLLLHFVIFEVCNFFIKSKYKNKILLVQPSFADQNFEVFNYINKDQIVKFILNSFHKLNSCFPFPVLVYDKSINLYDLNTGEVREVLIKSKEVINTYLLKTPNMRDIKKFTEKNGLKFLHNQYFNEQQFKSIFY